jgi:hypothetical protein
VENQFSVDHVFETSVRPWRAATTSGRRFDIKALVVQVSVWELQSPL